MDSNTNDLTDDEFAEAVAEFIGAFETVFRYDWTYTLASFSPYQKEGATFLEPGLQDEFDDWASYGFLLEKYRQLVAIMKRHGLSPIFPIPLERIPGFKGRVW